jgi:hypothetical protein
MNKDLATLLNSANNQELKSTQLHQLAQNLLEKGLIVEAWKVLLSE